MRRPAQLVVSYSHKDEQLRQELVSALSPAVRAGELVIWSDHRIVPGADIDTEIMSQLKEADAVLLLVSHDFVASDYCFKKELEVALERHANGRAVVLPVIARPTDFEGLPFARLKMLPYDAKALTLWENRDEAWLNVVHGVRAALRGISKPNEEPTFFRSNNIRECLTKSFDELQKRYVDAEKVREDGTGFRDVDNILGGLEARELMLLAGRPGSGFLELSTSILQFCAFRHKKRVLVLSQRLSSQQYANRMLCSVGLISLEDLQTGQLEDEDWSRVTSAIRMLTHTDITIDDQPIRSLEELKDKLAQAKEMGHQVILLDGLEYLSTTGSNKEERAIAFALHDFAKTADVSIICTLSLGHEIDVRAYRKPLMADLKEWNGLEHASQKILFTSRPELYSLNGIDYGQVSDFYVNIAKNVNGVVSEVELRLHTYSGAVSDRYMYEEAAKVLAEEL